MLAPGIRPKSGIADVLEASNSVEGCRDAPTGLLLIGQPKTPRKKEIPFVREEVENFERQLGM